MAERRREPDDEPPAPLVAPEVNLRAFPAVLLDIHDIRSGVLARMSAPVFQAAITLMAASWHEVPAASLPDDDVALALLAGCGRDQRAWKRLRADGALAGWASCSDGRLYHPGMAAAALQAWEHAQRSRERREVDAQRLREWRKLRRGRSDGALEPSTASASPPEDEALLKRVSSPCLGADETGTVGVRKRREGEESTSSLRSDGAPAPPSPAAVAPDVRSELFGAGLARLRRLTGKSDGQARGMLGRWLRDLGDDCPGLNRVLFEAEDARPADPAAWIEAAVRSRRGERPPPMSGRAPRRGNGIAEAMRRMHERGDLGHGPIFGAPQPVGAEPVIDGEFEEAEAA